MKYLQVLILITGFIVQLDAQVSWDGEAGDGLWSSKGNWSKDELPIASDEVIIGQDFVVLADVSTTVKEISLEDEGVLNVVGSVVLTIEESDRIGLEIAVNAEITNEGSILILNADFIGILNHGHLNNTHGLISVDNSNFSGIRNTQHITNTGEIIIENCLENALINDGVLENENSIILSNNFFKGLTNDGLLVNQGQIMINATTNGTALINSDTLYNEPQAKVEISQASEHGVNNTGVISNKGKLTVSNAERGIMNYATLLNSDSIVVRSATALGLYSNDSLYNSATGYIYLDDTGGSGISSDTESRIHNVGIIKIKNVAWGMLNYGYVRNEYLIRIDSVIHGIDTDGVFVNESMVAVVNASEEGLSNDSLFYNQIEGLVGLENTKIGLINSGYLKNMHAIGIGGFLEKGLHNTGYLMNESSAEISVFGNEIGDELTIGIENDSTIYSYGLINVYEIDSLSIYNKGSIHLDWNEGESRMEVANGYIRNVDSIVVHQSTILLLDGVFDNLGFVQVIGQLELERSEAGPGLINTGQIVIEETGILGAGYIPNNSLEALFGSTLICRGVIVISLMGSS